MANNVVDLNFTYYFDPDKGRPLFFAYVFIGEPNLDPEILANRKTVTLEQQDGSTVEILPAAQPLRTGAGGGVLYNGSLVTVLTNGNYSLKVLDNQTDQKIFINDAFEGVPALRSQVFLEEDSVDDMINNAGIVIGEYVITPGYNFEGDGGDNTYVCEAVTADPDDGGRIIKSIANPLVQFRGLFPKGVIDVKQFGALGDGVTDDYNAIDACKSYAESISAAIRFLTPGIYNHSSFFNFNIDEQSVEFGQGIILSYTGSDLAGIRFDSGTSGLIEAGSFGFPFPPTIRAPSAPYGVYVRSWHRSRLNFICDAATVAALRVEFSVLTQYYVVCSRNVKPFVVQPIEGISLVERNTGEAVTACDFFCVIEGVSGEGVSCINAQYNRFYGTSEGNDGGGYTEGSGSKGNHLIDFFCELNGNTDYNLAGSETVLENCVSSSDSGLVVTGDRNIASGIFHSTFIGAGADDTVLRDLKFVSTEAGGLFDDNSSSTIYENLRMNSTLGSVGLPQKTRRPKIKAVGPTAITGISNTEDCFITVSGDNLDHGESITITDATGLTELNGNTYQVEQRNSNSYWILSGGANVDSTGFGIYTGSGIYTNVPFTNGWLNTGAGQRNAGYCITSEGLVILVGSINGGTIGLPAFTLPAAYSPPASILIAVASATAPSTSFVQIASGGNVTVTTGDNTAITLDGISYQI